jgi:hypothetical protein
MSWTQQVRSALSDSGQTIYRVSIETGISAGKLHGFAFSGKNLSVENLEILGKYLGFRLVRKPVKTISENG